MASIEQELASCTVCNLVLSEQVKYSKSADKCYWCAKRVEAAEAAQHGLVTVETDTWVRGADGLLHSQGQRTIHAVWRELKTALGPNPWGAEDHFGPAGVADMLWPKGRIACFSVRGGSEGDYAHVEVLGQGAKGKPTREPVLLAKTFNGREASWAFAKAIADLLGV